MTRYIDIYCERLEPGLWAEPVNAITNASFFVAAFMAWLLLSRQSSLRDQIYFGGSNPESQENSMDCRVADAPRNDAGAHILILLTLAMGIGSTLFHTYAQLWAMLADVLPILLYQIAFIALYTRYLMRRPWWQIGALLFTFVLLMQAFMALPRDWLNGSLEYAPALIFLSGFALYHLKHARTEKYGLLLAAGVFVISLTFRSVDMELCPDFPLGTHFMWHILNGLVLYLTTRAYILNASCARSS